MTLDKYCNEYLQAWGNYNRKDFQKFRKQIELNLVNRLSDMSEEDITWLEKALRESDQKLFVLFVFSFPSILVPEALFSPMIRAAIYNSGINRSFIEPCIKSFGHRRVYEALIEFFEVGSDLEKAGAAAAFYWVQVNLKFPAGVRKYTIENATPESRRAYEALADLQMRKNCLILEEFVRNSNMRLRRCLKSDIKLEKSYYPEELKPLVDEAYFIYRDLWDD